MKRLTRKLFKHFTEGFVIVAPFGFTIGFVIYGLNKFHQGLVLIVKYIPYFSRLATPPGFNLLTILLAVCLIGYMSSNFIVKYFLDLIEHILLNIPVLGLVYSYIKESASGFLGKFDTPVLVTINASLQVVKAGFLTQENLKRLHMEDMVAVYLPYAYSFAGETMLVPTKQVKVLEGVSSTDLFRFALTGGLAEIKQPLIVKE